MAGQAIYDFGGWRLEVANGLFREGRLVHVAPKELEALRVLVESGGCVVGKEELRGAVWPDVFVSDDSLTRCIYVLRKTLGEAGAGPYIETVARRGYRFVTAVRRVTADEGEAAPPLRLAVLPFDTAVDSPEEDRMREGLAEELIARMSRLHGYGLVVIARGTALRYRDGKRSLEQVTRELRLDWVVTGSIQLRPDTVRIHAELVRATDHAQVWSESFERPRAALDEAPAELAAAIAARLSLRLPGSARDRLARTFRTTRAAYETYLDARHHWYRRGRDDVRRALSLYEAVVRADPGYAPAHAGIAECWNAMPWLSEVWPVETAVLARQSIERALALAPDLAQAHAASGVLESRHGWNEPEADASFRRALALDPGDTDAHYFFGRHLIGVGRFDEGLGELDAALELDPHSPLLNGYRAFALYLARRLDEALAEGRRALAIAPGFPMLQSFFLVIASESGALSETLSMARHGMETASAEMGTVGRVCAATVLARAGETAGPRALLDTLSARARRRYVMPAILAPLALALGAPDAALDLLELAREQRCVWLNLVLPDPRLDVIRGHPRFAAVDAAVRGGGGGAGRSAAEDPLHPSGAT
jgi:DNA-binding winged helix-turn-helix (wHTH) protein/tetratricopeptide (TPR) repeat protein